MTLDASCFQTELILKVPFHDVDAMGVVWHGNYFRYFEQAREQLLDQFDYGYRAMKASGYLWPVVDTRVKYIAPLTFGQIIRLCAHITEYENRLRIAYQIIDQASGKKCTSGYTIQVAVDAQTRELCYASPDILFEKMGGSHEA